MKESVERKCSLYLLRLGFVPLLVVGTDLRVLTKGEQGKKRVERETERANSK